MQITEGTQLGPTQAMPQADPSSPSCRQVRRRPRRELLRSGIQVRYLAFFHSFFFFDRTTDRCRLSSIKTAAAYFAKTLNEQGGNLLLALGTYNGVRCSPFFHWPVKG